MRLPGRRRAGMPERVAQSTIVDPEQHTVMDADGAVRSVQAADIRMPEEQLVELWSPMHLEQLARTYWTYLSRFTLGLARVVYTEDARLVVLLARPLVLLRFHPPEYTMDRDHGQVRWRIRDGLLVASAGRERDGYLQIDVRRCPDGGDGMGRLHVEIEIANFYPALAARLPRFLYEGTQSRVHVFVTHGFLRRIARLDLEPSVVGRFVETEAAQRVPGAPTAVVDRGEPAGSENVGDAALAKRLLPAGAAIVTLAVLVRHRR